MENKTILNIILVSILVIYLSAFTYIMVAYVAPSVRNKRKKRGEADSINEGINPQQPSFVINSSQTEFYKKSVQHAEKVLSGKSFDPQYGEANFYGNKLIDTIGKINNETKKSVIIAINYFSIEPSQARVNEQLFRTMSEQEKVPLWFVILREAVKKAVPEFSQGGIPMQDGSKIIPLYQKTG